MARLVVALSLLAACGDNRQAPPQTSPEAGSALPDAAPDAPDDDFITLRSPGQPGKPRVLLYTFENYWHHYSMLECMNAVLAMQTTRGFTIVMTNHPLAINAKNLADVDVVVFCVTSGSGLIASGKADLEAWIRAGGGVVGFHSMTATESRWPFFIANTGTGFAGHADGIFPATVRLDPTHPITAGLPDLQLTDEWYFFSQRPETIPGAQMLLTLDESTLPANYPAINLEGYHPIGWANDRFGGRMFYSAFGHNPTTFHDPEVLEIVGRAIEWAAHQR
jgi:type 1 glutamine amidotransferase